MNCFFITKNYSEYTEYVYFNEGYVKLDDWKDINADKFIKQMRSDSKEANKIRRENNSETVEGIEWLQEPTLDREKNSVYYAYLVEYSDGAIAVNAITLILGRYGYTEVTYVGYPEDFKINKEENKKAIKLLKKNKKISYEQINQNEKVSKVSVGGAGMITQPGVAKKFFKALEKKKINIMVISTSEIKISVLIHQKNTNKAVKEIGRASCRERV